MKSFQILQSIIAFIAILLQIIIGKIFDYEIPALITGLLISLGLILLAHLYFNKSLNEYYENRIEHIELKEYKLIHRRRIRR